MILSDLLILEEINKGNIIIEPFDKDCLGTNSYDVHLGKYLATYKNRVLDAKHIMRLIILKSRRMVLSCSQTHFTLELH